jgi:hypothetical protein
MEQENVKTPPKDNPRPKKSRRRKLILWLMADLGVALILLYLLFYKPHGYIPNKNITNQETRKIVPRYWTLLGSEIYNQSQLGVPFDLVIEEDRLNEAIQQGTWPQTSDSAKLYAPTATLQNGFLQLMGTAEFSGADFILTIQISSNVDPNGMASLNLTSIKVGAMNITPVAKLIARKAYQHQIATMMADPDRIETKLLSSLLESQAFDPVFEVRNIDHRRASVRVTAVEVQQGRITARLTPLK